MKIQVDVLSVVKPCSIVAGYHAASNFEVKWLHKTIRRHNPEDLEFHDEELHTFY